MAAAPPATGYSGTPLAKKLGITPGSRVLLLDAPEVYLDLFDAFPEGVRFEAAPSRSVDLVHLFATRKAVLAKHLLELRRTLNPAAVLWVSWPKKAAKLPTDITEDTIRELALPLGWVDVKVCAVNAIWSGLKLVLRKELR